MNNNIKGKGIIKLSRLKNMICLKSLRLNGNRIGPKVSKIEFSVLIIDTHYKLILLSRTLLTAINKDSKWTQFDVAVWINCLKLGRWKQYILLFLIDWTNLFN